MGLARILVALAAFTLGPNLAKATAIQQDNGSHAAASTPRGGGLVVIVSNNSPLRNIDQHRLRRIFLGESTRLAGQRMVPINLDTSRPERVRFDAEMLQLRPDEVGRYWVNRKIRGRGSPPRSVRSPKLLVQIIERLPGSIAVVAAQHVTPGVRVLTIDGVSPDKPGYALTTAGGAP